MKIENLMALAEASNGFVGGSIVDELPGMSLAECVHALPVEIMRSQIDLSESVRSHNDALVEATVVAMTTGTPADFNALAEGALETVGNKIKAFFEKIKKFIRSIIDKIKMQLDKWRMSGKQLWSKYKNDPALKGKSFEDLTVTGYRFEKDGEAFPAVDGMMSAEAITNLIKGVGDIETPSAFAAGSHTDGAKMEEFESKLEKLADISTEDRRAHFAKALTGIEVSGSDWQGEVKKELYGDKVDLKYGEDFTYDSIGKTLENGANLDKIKNSYTKLLTAVEKEQQAMEKSLNELKKGYSKNAKVGEEAPKGDSLTTKYYNAYLALYQECTGVITAVQGIRHDYETTKMNQAKAIFSKMLSYKGKKDNSDASNIEGMEDFDFEV